ncbi:MAG: transglutaminase family protein [Dehalococcoidia bacterium]|nr:MAG: transglutaminase family protein [Dehalococcoidia bacterium]
MNTTGKLSDFKHPAIAAKAKELTEGEVKRLEKIEAIFHFMRDGIKFGLPSTWDEMKASEVLECGFGYCNTKATLFVALCKAADMPARIHCSIIDAEIMRGVFPGFAFLFLPKTGLHSWIDVEIDGEWKQCDTYINDKALYEGSLKLLRKSGKAFGYSIAFQDGKSSCEFNFGEEGFVHMGAVIEDHGTWDDLSEYIASAKYVRMNQLLLMMYPMMAAITNRRIARIREQ